MMHERIFKPGEEVQIKGTRLFGTFFRLNADGMAEVKMASGERRNLPIGELEAPRAAPKPSLNRPRPPLRFLSYREMTELPEPKWLVDGLIMERSSALLFGKSNSFKSFLAVDIACSIATADHELDEEKRDTTWHGSQIGNAGSVLYVATEGALGVAKQRIPGWMDAHDVPEEYRGGIVLYPEEIALDDEKAVDALIRSAGLWDQADGWCDPAHAFRLIVIDIFGASMMGPETSDETARAWVQNINRIMRTIKCAVLTVAHTGWADDTRARMHTHFWGSFDTRLKAEGDKDSLTTFLKVERHKDADSAGEWGFQMEVVPTPFGNTTLVPRLSDEVQKGQKRRVSGKPAIALQALSEALLEHGRKIQSPSYPACPVVSIEQWRSMCDRHGLCDSDNTETRRKAFHRAKAELMAKGLIRQFDDNVWKAEHD